MVHAYKVGELYVPGRTTWPEVAEYNYRRGAHELRLFYGNLKDTEIKAITRRPAEFGAVTVGSVLFFLFKFDGDGDWSDAPYSWHLVAKQQPDQATEPPPLEEMERSALTIILVEATTGAITGLRVVSLSINLSRYLHQAIAAQIAAPFDEAAYDTELARIYATTSTAELARRAERQLVR